MHVLASIKGASVYKSALLQKPNFFKLRQLLAIKIDRRRSAKSLKGFHIYKKGLYKNSR